MYFWYVLKRIVEAVIILTIILTYIDTQIVCFKNVFLVQIANNTNTIFKNS